MGSHTVYAKLLTCTGTCTCATCNHPASISCMYALFACLHAVIYYVCMIHVQYMAAC